MSTDSLSLAAPPRTRTLTLSLSRKAVWNVVWIAMAGAAAYFLVPQLGEVQASLASLERVHPVWLAAGAIFVLLRYVLSAIALRAALGRPLAFGPTLLVQVSSSFIGRLTPEGVGWLVLNQRFLEQAGINRASALAGLALKVFAAVVTRIAITAAVAAIVGGSSSILHLD